MAWEWIEIVKQFDAQGRFYHDILDQMPSCCIALTSVEGHILFANQAFLHFFRISGPTLGRTSIFDVLSKDVNGNEDKAQAKRVKTVCQCASTSSRAAISEDLEVYVLHEKYQFRIAVLAIKHWDASAAPGFLIVLESLEKKEDRLRGSFPKAKDPSTDTLLMELGEAIAALKDKDPEVEAMLMAKLDPQTKVRLAPFFEP